MIVAADAIVSFMTAVREALASAAFVRLTLGKYRGAGEVQKLVATRVVIKDQPQVRLVTSERRKDTTDTLATDAALQKIERLLGSDFASATLFTTAKDVTLSFNNKKEARLTQGKPTFTSAPPAEHDRAKQYAVEASRPYLEALGVSSADGTVKPSMYGKFKQICHFIEIIDDLLRQSALTAAREVSVVDIGSGKGYLTFALYDFLTSKLGKRAIVTGIEVRQDLARRCSELAKKSAMSGLTFEAAAAAEQAIKKSDITIALHACDTATDDALAQGIAAGSALIVCAPCCQHEIAPQLSGADAALAGLMKFGLFKQRQADLVTDAARCLLLEASGYKVKVIEFVSTEHTAKNLMIAAIRSAAIDREAALRHYAALKALMGFATHHLERRLRATGALDRA